MSVSAALPTVEFTTLRKRVEETKSPSTSRYYIAMLNRLEAYNQAPALDLSSVDAAYVADFGEYLVHEGVTFSTIKLFKMAFRAVMKDAYGPDHKSRFKAAFKDVGSGNEAPAGCISYRELLKIAGCDLRNIGALERIRLVFLYCVVAGGLTLEALRQMLQAGDARGRLPQQKKIVGDFSNYCRSGFEEYVERLADEQYSQALEAIGVTAGISAPLTPQSAAAAWIALARKADLPAKDMASILPSSVAMLGNAAATTDIPEEARTEILKSAANALFDMKPRWFVMRCYKAEPAEIDRIIADAGLLMDPDTFTSFIPPVPKVPKNKPSVKKSLLGDMYFFNCAASTAAAIRKALRETAWVYTLAGTSTPAQISDSEMRTFMLLCDVSQGTLTDYFPESGAQVDDLAVGREARVINGDFCGQVGIIKQLPDNKYKVVMTFTSLCAKVTAEIPVDFLKLT